MALKKYINLSVRLESDWLRFPFWFRSINLKFRLRTEKLDIDILQNIVLMEALYTTYRTLYIFPISIHVATVKDIIIFFCDISCPFFIVQTKYLYTFKSYPVIVLKLKINCTISSAQLSYKLNIPPILSRTII